ncbi:MAG: PH domain-containing protein [Coriobacteriaceae bacterium]|nr:PH domain-containing protein [Coriobacteriaceae bacterium]
MKLVQVALSIVLVVVVSVLPIVMSGDMKADVGTVGIGVTVSLLFMVPTLAVSALVLYLSYKHLSYEIGEKEFSLYSGVFNKKKAHVPYQRIQSVNQQASLMQRIFGICTVHIDTAGGSSNKAVVVPFLQNSEAERLRAELFARKQVVMGGSVYGTPGVTGSAAVAAAPYGQVSAYGQASAYGQVPSPGYNVLDAPAEIMGGMRGVFGGTQIDTGQVSYEYGLKNKELLLTGLSNSTGFMVVAFTIIGTIVGFVATLTGVDSRLYEWGMGIFSRAFAGQLIWFGILMLVGIVLVVWIASIIGTCFSYGGFRAARRANRVEVEYGLLQHRFQGVDVDRIQSVIIKQGFIRRLIGYGELSLGKVEARVNNEEQGQTFNLVVHPFIKMSKVPGVLAGLIPEFADVPSLLTPLPRVSLRRALIRRCVVQGSGFWLAVMVTFAYLAIRLAAPELFVRSYFPIDAIAQAAYVLCALIAVLEAVNAVMWSRHSGFAYNHRFMQVVNAGFSVTKVSFPRKKIQYAYTRSNPFQRASQVATINIRTAAGIGGTTLHLVDVREDDAEKWLDWVLPRKAVLQ